MSKSLDSSFTNDRNPIFTSISNVEEVLGI
jgi:hypothetical protein